MKGVVARMNDSAQHCQYLSKAHIVRKYASKA